MRPLTRSCFLLLALGRLFLLAFPVLLGICPRSRWRPPFPLHALALIPLFLAKVRLSPTLTLSSLMIWCFEQMALFLFLLARAAAAFLPTALSVALRPLFPFWQAQYAQVFPLKPASFCTLFAGLSSTNKSAISLLLSDSRSVLATLSSPPSFLLSQTLWQIWQELYSLSSCFIRLQWVPGHSFLPGNDAADELARRGVFHLRTPLSLVVSLLLSLVSTLVFSRTGGILSHRSSLTLRFPRFPPRNLCSLVMLAVFSLVYTATDTAFFWVFIFLGLAESRMLPAVPVDTRPRTSLISFCTVQLRTVCAAHSLATLWLFTTSGPDPGELPGSWGSMVFRHAPILRKGSFKQQQQQIEKKCFDGWSA